MQNATINNCRFHCRPLLPTKYWAAPASTSLYGDVAIPVGSWIMRTPESSMRVLKASSELEDPGFYE